MSEEGYPLFAIESMLMMLIGLACTDNTRVFQQTFVDVSCASGTTAIVGASSSLAGYS